MIEITFPDGKTCHYEQPVTGLEIATNLSKSLAKVSVAVRVNDELWDLTRSIDTNATISIIKRTDPEGIELLRHDAAHIMAQAVQELYPHTQVTIGPAIENGFFYDFHRTETFSFEDLAKIENRMHAIVERDDQIVRHVWDRSKAIEFFTNLGETFKVEIIKDLPQDAQITVYQQGRFTDLCRGPHLPSTKLLGKGFKLMKLAGAYWRGDSTKPVLQRIYGTAWPDEKELAAYLHRLEEAEKRDHRKLGKEMGLFHLQEEAIGSVFWHPKGWKVYRKIENYIRSCLGQDYVEVKTPQLVDKKLWEKSGHWEKFQESMFTVENDQARTYAIKPMNCPCHVEIFKQGTKSYRDLPLRMAEFGACHRNEPSGALHGLMRVRAFTQDDAHIFCTEEQITSETQKFCDLLKKVYKDFGFTDISVKFSDRPDKRAGSDEVWDKAESSLKEATVASELEYTINPGEGAFYGPKLEFVLRDAIGREWQCGTLQVDFVLPERLGASYTGADGNAHRPVILHRAILGSFERFLGVLIEHYAGNLPLWLAPVPVVVTPITNDFDAYAIEVRDALMAMGIDAEIDLRNEKISYKIRDLSCQKIPVILVVGKREQEERTVTMRKLGSTEQTIVALEAVIAYLAQETKIPSSYKGELQ